MKPFLITFLLLAGFYSASCQKVKVDSVIDRQIYQSFFSFKYKAPLYVTYTLYKGGGDCDRQTEGFGFKADNCRRCAKAGDYSNSHYEKGHLANAEDFAFDCDKEELTFRYYNCLPQTTECNHGQWLHWEDKVRQLSEDQKLFIIAGGIYGTKTIGKGKVGVPDYCYKIVLNAKTQKILVCMIFPNDQSRGGEDITLAALKKKLGYDLMPAGYWRANW